jgi:hypothetical protein
MRPGQTTDPGIFRRSATLLPENRLLIAHLEHQFLARHDVSVGDEGRLQWLAIQRDLLDVLILRVSILPLHHKSLSAGQRNAGFIKQRTAEREIRVARTDPSLLHSDLLGRTRSAQVALNHSTDLAISGEEFFPLCSYSMQRAPWNFWRCNSASMPLALRMN